MWLISWWRRNTKIEATHWWISVRVGRGIMMNGNVNKHVKLTALHLQSLFLTKTLKMTFQLCNSWTKKTRLLCKDCENDHTYALMHTHRDTRKWSYKRPVQDILKLQCRSRYRKPVARSLYNPHHQAPAIPFEVCLYLYTRSKNIYADVIRYVCKLVCVWACLCGCV